MTPRLAVPALLLASVLAHPASSRAQLRLTAPLGDGMVLQRDVRVPVRGTADPGGEVTVTFRGARHAARPDASGRWEVVLPPMSAGGPFEMTVAAGGERLRVQDVLVGDVWLCSGQSNIEWTVADSKDAEQEIASAGDPMIRHFKVPRSWARQPEDTLAGGEWQPADPAHVGGFTAVGYFFARALRREVDVPIGLINSSWGGSRIEPWMSREALGLGTGALDEVLRQEREQEERVMAGLRARIGELPREDAGLADGRARWAAPDLDDAEWARIETPAAWEGAGYPGMDGVGWYRTTFDLTPEEARAGIVLGLGTIDDSDVSWVNGHEIGRTEQAWNRPRRYEAPPAVLKPGRNVVAVRVQDTGGGGGIHGDPALLYLESGGRRRPLAGTWRFRVGAVSISLDDQKNQLPTLLYNKMIHPLLPYPIKGVLWYQGESNAYPQAAYAYREQFAAMIRDWRARWGVGDFPFLWVQLAAYMPADAEPAESPWAVLRESQSAALALPNTAQAIAIDLGEADDIHPRNKQDVGERLALAARKVAYGENVVHSGPVYRRHEIRDGRVVIEFDHVGEGLTARGQEGELHGFAVAGADRRFVWARARIEDGRVVVWSDEVPRPAAVRYAWGNNPEHANLYNVHDLPAAPFRTDDW